jgi:hypothetical protein
MGSSDGLMIVVDKVTVTDCVGLLYSTGSTVKIEGIEVERKFNHVGHGTYST